MVFYITQDNLIGIGNLMTISQESPSKKRKNVKYTHLIFIKSPFFVW